MKRLCLTALLIIIAVPPTGCNVDTKGLFQPQSSYAVPLRALGLESDGNLIVRSGRNATVTYNELGADGSTKAFQFTADASGVIGSQASAVNAVENQRYTFLASELRELRSMIAPILPIVSQYAQGLADIDLRRRNEPPAEPSGPSRLDRMEAMLEKWLAAQPGGGPR